MPSETDFEQVFQRLKTILEPYAATMRVTIDTAAGYHLDAAYDPKLKRPLSFAAIVIKKNYVSFHLVPLYVLPALAEEVSPELKKRMQGMACFNFTKVDDGLFGELEVLAEKGFEEYRAAARI